MYDDLTKRTIFVPCRHPPAKEHAWEENCEYGSTSTALYCTDATVILVKVLVIVLVVVLHYSTTVLQYYSTSTVLLQY